MAPRRNNSLTGGVGTLDVHSLLAGLTDSTEHLDSASSSAASPAQHQQQQHQHGYHQHQHQHHHHQQQQPQQQHATNGNGNGAGISYTRCCVPAGDCFKATPADYGLINLDAELRDCVRVLCNNENCTAGQYMHRECFDAWEQGVLSYLKTIGRARAWSERQRGQNLWTKKGYDLVFKACGCKCGRGHLKKDLDWVAPVQQQQQLAVQPPSFGRSVEEDASKKKKKRNRNGQNQQQQQQNHQHKSGMSAVGTGIVGSIGTFSVAQHQHSGNGGAGGHMSLGGILGPLMEQHQQQQPLQQQQQQQLQLQHRNRAGSLSSSNGSSSPPASGSSEHSISPVHHTGVTKKQTSKVEAYSERVRTTSGCNGIFSRRLDFSTFNMLPKTRLNSYQIKMEDEGNHGNDETRLFILSSLAQHQKSRVACILCEESMLVFDRYPLVDGTFFLSPKQHSKGCIEVKYDGHTQYLTAVCMGCLEGVSTDRVIRCRFCAQKWEGSSLVLGTMYAYDIFAAMPCCTERLKCNNCYKLLLYPHQRLNFFSDYSHVVSCVHCTTQDTHFVKPLAYCYTKQPLQAYQQWP